jgi:hypothetical protein
MQNPVQIEGTVCCSRIDFQVIASLEAILNNHDYRIVLSQYPSRCPDQAARNPHQQARGP